MKDLVSCQQFWLFTPPRNNNAEKWWYLINEDDWQTIVRPGMQLRMSLYLPDSGEASQFDSGQASVDISPPRRSFIARETSSICFWKGSPGVVNFMLPTPIWQNLPDDLGFKWL